MKMRDPKTGIELKTIKRRFTKYEDCFEGSNAVSWIARNCNVTRKNANAFGQYLVNRHIVNCVGTNDHKFVDGKTYYQFRVRYIFNN